MKNIFYIILILSVLLSGCLKTTEDLETGYDIPIVASFLSPGNELLIRLTSAIPYTNDTSLAVSKNLSDLQVYIHSDSITYILTEIIDSAGYYKDMSEELQIAENKTYLLEFEYNDINVTSSTLTPIKPENFETSVSSIELEKISEESGWSPPNMTDIELSWDDVNNDYYLINIQYMEDEYDTVNTIIEIEDAYEMANFTSEPLQDNVYTIRSMQFMFFGEYRIILYRISEEYAQLYETLSQSSLEGLAEPPTNIVNGKGIFAAFNSDTLSFNVIEE